MDKQRENTLTTIEDFISRCDELADEILENIESTKKEIKDREMERKPIFPSD